MMEEMAEEEPRPRGSLEFVESSVLDTFVPLETDLNIEDALKGSVERLDRTDSPLAAIPQRHALFFDETVNIYVVLQTPYFDERALKSYLGRLVINLDAEVVNAQADTHDGPPGKESIYSASVQDTDDPVILVQGPDEDDEHNEGHVLVVWKMSAPLVRSRLRLSNPSIRFSASANLKAAEPIETETTKEEYLPSQTPSGLNLLESFGEDPALKGIKPRLSALRVSRVAPVTQATQNLMRSLKTISHQTIKIYAAVNARVRYSRPKTAPSISSMIASLDIEITPFTNCKVSLEQVQFDIVGGDIEDLNKIPGMELPIVCFPQDDITFLYRIKPEELDLTNSSQNRVFTLSLIATAHLTATCHPKITMNWNTTVDFTPPLNPSFVSQPSTGALQRAHKPTQLSIDSTSTSTNSPTPAFTSALHPDSLPTIEMTTRHSRNPSIPDFGITITFTSPPSSSPIHPGEPFHWTVFIVNRSPSPRKLALVAIPKRRRTEPRITRPPSSGRGAVRKDSKIADAVIDENIMVAMQRNSALEWTEIVPLSTDTRVGPLAPGACGETVLKFVALKVGALGVDAVRVVDLGNQEYVDVRDLPGVIVVPWLGEVEGREKVGEEAEDEDKDEDEEDSE